MTNEPSPTSPPQPPAAGRGRGRRRDPDKPPVTLDDIKKAREAVYLVAHRTPMLEPPSLAPELGAHVYLKAECLQHTGSFKVRGAANKLASLTEEERARGVIAASAGNHAQGVAVAARAFNVAATVVMPEGVALAKLHATQSYGAEVVLHGADYSTAMAKAKELSQERGLIYVPGYDDARIIAGQGTLGIEIIEECPEVELVLVPVGGGGLIAGIATVLKSLRPEIRVVGVQAKACPAAMLSLQSGEAVRTLPAPTLADGVAIPQPGKLPLELMRRYVDDIVMVDEEAIVQAIVLLIERAKLVTEGAGALAVAALQSGAVDAAGRQTVALLSGGNIDVNLLAYIVQHGLLHANRYVTLNIDIDDRPGTLAALLDLIARTGANVLEVDHLRQSIHLPVRGVEVRLLLETRDAAHIEAITARLAEAGYVLAASGVTSRGVHA
jgi:threonine dehydratase